MEDNSDRNINILTTALKKKEYSQNSRFWWLLGREYAAKKNNQKAIEVGIKSLSLLEKSYGRQRSQQLLELAILNIREKEYTTALDYASKSLVAHNLWREPYFELGRIFWYLGRYNEALQMFNICKSIPQPKSLTSIDLGLYDGSLLFDWFSLTYDRLEDFTNAIKYVKKALRLSPDDKRLLKNKAYWESKN